MLKATILIALVLATGSPDVVSGHLSQYDQAPTDGTLWYRQHESRELPMDMSMYAGVIAVADCDRIGQEAWLRIRYDTGDGEEYDSGWLLVVVFDCSGHLSTSTWMREDGIISEVGYYMAKKHGFLDRGNVRGELIWAEKSALSPESEAIPQALDNSSMTWTEPRLQP